MRLPGLAVAGLCLSVALVGCGDDGDTSSAEGGTGGSGQSDNLSGTIRIDGSSTVAPLSEAAAELFREEHSDVQVTVGTSGTGGGFEKFCNGETDISDASRPIKEDEAAACEQNGITYDEFTIANDALSVIVNPDNDWAQCLTVEQLNKIWAPDSEIDNWNQVDPSFPDEPLELFGPGTDSGTFDYFTEEINGEEGASRTDYNASEDDNVIVTGVGGNPGGLGYLGFSYVEENEGTIRAVEIDGGEGCVAPSQETVQDGSYVPLSRPLFIYPNAETLARPEGQAFVEFYVANTSDIAEQALYVPLTEEQQQELQSKLEELQGQSGGSASASASPSS